MKYEIKNNNLANILYYIGETFYKGINGVYYHFKVRKYKNLHKVYIGRPDNKYLLIFQLNENMEIENINDYINERFILPKGKINIENWQSYIVGGYKEV